jgi:hypothetical protein
MLPEGDIHPDLTKRLAGEAAWAADRVLQMCIRAIDYCPPVDITFGDFLRGIVTADVDYAPDDRSGFRVVFTESFREWGIYPRGVSSMGLDALVWPAGAELYDDFRGRRKLTHKAEDLRPHLKGFVAQAAQNWNLESNRFEVWKDLDRLKAVLWQWLMSGDSYSLDYARIFGLVVDELEAPPTVYRSKEGPTVEVHAVRPALRRTLDGSARTDLVIEITQRRRGYFDPDEQKRRDDRNDPLSTVVAEPDFIFRAGCTILVDPRTAVVRRVIRTRGTIASDAELDNVRRYLKGEIVVIGNAFDAGLPRSLRDEGPAPRNEPFALLHQMGEV